MSDNFAEQRENLIEECTVVMDRRTRVGGIREACSRIIDAAIRLGRLDGMEAATSTRALPALGPDDVVSVCSCGGRVLHLDEQWCCLDCGRHGGKASP